MYRKSNTGAAFQVNLNQVDVGWKKRSVSTNGWSRQIGGYTLRAFIHPTFFGSGSSGLGYCFLEVRGLNKDLAEYQGRY